MDTNVSLTSAELANIWGAYQNASITSKVLSYFDKKVDDEQIKEVIQSALRMDYSHLEKLSDIFHTEKIPLPVAFTEQDVNTDAPILFTDSYMLQYLIQMGRLGMGSFTQAISSATREDIYPFFSQGFRSYNDLHREALDLALEKGLTTKPPTIPKPETVDFVKKQSFLTGWLGERRPLTALEISNIYNNLERNSLGVTTLTGFSQVAKTKEVKEYITRGVEIAKKHTDIFRTMLNEGDVPAPTGSETMVTNENSTSPFSDKLMMIHVTSMIGIGTTFYGMSISTNIRRDLATKYARLSAEIGKYAEDGANIMIENGWLEEPPRMVDRQELAANNRKE